MAWEDRAYYREGSYGSGPRFVFPMPTKLTFGLILACLAVFVAQSVTGHAAALSPLVYWGKLTFEQHRAFTQPWRWITYQYLHGSGGHIFFNLLTIYFFVPMLERIWGWQKTLAFYTLGGILAGITFGLIQLIYPPGLSLIGASGAVLAVIGALAALVPDSQVILLVFPMTMRTMALLFGVLYILSVLGDRSPSDAAHLGGLVFGWLLPRYAGTAWRGAFRQFQEQRVHRLVKADQQERENVDRILQKVHESGMQSLSWQERRTLKKATEHQRHRDAELARVRRHL
jgi:membrane associated rhomboid family serine protease